MSQVVSYQDGGQQSATYLGGLSYFYFLNISKFNTRSIENYESIFEGINDTNNFTIIYNESQTEEIKNEIKKIGIKKSFIK